MTKVFIISPFGSPYDEQYESLIRPAIEALGYEITRGDDIYGAGPIIDDIFEEITTADIVLADVTGKNPNVNYELGIAHALQKPTIIITRSIDDAPFDYRHIRIIVYDPQGKDWQAEFLDALRETVRAVLQGKSAPYQADIIEKHLVATQVRRLGGLRNVFQSRQGMNLYLDQVWSDSARQIDVMAFGLKSFRDAKTADVIRDIGNGLKMRLLVPSPRSEFLLQRELEENLNPGSISRTIQDLAAWTEDINKRSNSAGFVTLKYYEGLPQNFYWRQDGHIFVGPYMRGLGSQQTITYHFDAESRLGDYFSGHFEVVWKSSTQ